MDISLARDGLGEIMGHALGYGGKVPWCCKDDCVEWGVGTDGCVCSELELGSPLVVREGQDVGHLCVD